MWYDRDVDRDYKRKEGVGMKRIVAAVVAALLVAALAASALAEFGETWHLFALEDDVPVYAEKDRNSKIVKKLERGEQVDIAERSKSGNWYSVYYEKNGKQRTGWVQAKYLGDQPPCEHRWSDWQVYQQATCIEKGLRIRTCTRCGASEAMDIPKLPHSYGNWKVTREPTCTREGERVRTCKVCGAEETKAVDKLEHTFGEWTVLKEATCTELGKRERECEVCGFVEKKDIDLLPHEYGAWQVVVETTDHSAGTRRRVCAVCGHADNQSFDPAGTLRRGARGDAVREIQQLLADQGYLKGSGVDGIFGPGVEKSILQFQADQGLVADGVAWPQTIQRLHHEFGPWVSVVKLTRDADGERVRTCVDCGYQDKQTVKAGTTYERRARGEGVRTLQTLLNDLGYSAGTADGIYGQKLDNAYDAFAADHGVDGFEPGRVTPEEVDALVNAWIAEQGKTAWKGAGDEASPVDLVLRVHIDADQSDADVMTFNWTLTNKGTEPCTFDALLLNYDREAEFSRDNLVIALDGTTLKANGANTASGTFSVAADWGEGRLRFAALGTSQRTGAVWLSNTRTHTPAE